MCEALMNTTTAVSLKYGRIVVSAQVKRCCSQQHAGTFDLPLLGGILSHALRHCEGEPLAIRPVDGVLLTLYESGRLVITGEVSLEVCIQHADELSAALQGEALDFQILSLTGHFTLPSAPNLELLHEALAEHCFDYDPHHPCFKGLILRLQGSSSSLLVFETGRVICLGARSHTELQNAFRKGLRLILHTSSNKP
jgi:hypothetical protein